MLIHSLDAKSLVLGVLEEQMLCHMAGNETCAACDQDVLWLIDGGHWLLGDAMEPKKIEPETSVAGRCWHNFVHLISSNPIVLLAISNHPTQTVSSVTHFGVRPGGNASHRKRRDFLLVLPCSVAECLSKGGDGRVRQKEDALRPCFPTRMMQLQDMTSDGKCVAISATSILPTIRVDTTHLDRSPSQSKIPYCPFAPSDSVTAWVTPQTHAGSMVMKTMQVYNWTWTSAARIDLKSASSLRPQHLFVVTRLFALEANSFRFIYLEVAHQEKLRHSGEVARGRVIETRHEICIDLQ